MEALILKQKPSILLLLLVFFSFAPAAFSQTIPVPLANLPEADVLIYISPQRTLSDFIPKVMPAKDVADMQTAFADMKKAVGIDPTTVEYVVIALRFHRPAADLSFVPPDVMAVVGGDFSSESLLTLAQLAFQDKVLTEKLGSKTLSVMSVDAIAKQAERLHCSSLLSTLGPSLCLLTRWPSATMLTSRLRPRPLKMAQGASSRK